MRLLRCHQNMRGAFRALQASAPHQGECGVYLLGQERLAREGKPLSGGLPCILAVRAVPLRGMRGQAEPRIPKSAPFREEQGMSRPLPAQIA